MSKSAIRFCPHCDAKIVEYKQSLGTPLIRGLMALYRQGGVAHITDLRLTYSQQCNFQKLRYFGLVEPPERNGVWRITDKGRAFLEGSTDCAKHVWTFRGQVERMEGPRITVQQVVGGYQKWQEWAAQAVPHFIAPTAMRSATSQP